MKLFHGKPDAETAEEVLHIWLDKDVTGNTSILRYKSNKTSILRYKSNKDPYSILNFFVSIDPATKTLTVWENDLKAHGLTLVVDHCRG